MEEGHRFRYQEPQPTGTDTTKRIARRSPRLAASAVDNVVLGPGVKAIAVMAAHLSYGDRAFTNRFVKYLSAAVAAANAETVRGLLCSRCNAAIGLLGEQFVLGQDMHAALRRADAARAAHAQGASVAVAPELALCGYPPEDLLLRNAFYAKTREALDGLASDLARGKSAPGCCMGCMPPASRRPVRPC